MGRGDEREQQSVSRYGEKSSVERLNFQHILKFFFFNVQHKSKWNVAVILSYQLSD